MNTCYISDSGEFIRVLIAAIFVSVTFSTLIGVAVTRMWMKK